MGKILTEIDEPITAFINKQRLFFVATAPLGPDGHPNVSPKGHDTFRILGPTTVCYLDLTGSGVETLAHIKENGRIVLMFCSFDDTPRIVRLHGKAEAIEPGHPEYAELRELYPDGPGARSVIRIEVSRIANSCGFGVPIYRFEKERPTMIGWYVDQGEEELAAYRRRANQHSIDGLEGVAPGGDPSPDSSD